MTQYKLRFFLLLSRSMSTTKFAPLTRFLFQLLTRSIKSITWFKNLLPYNCFNSSFNFNIWNKYSKKSFFKTKKVMNSFIIQLVAPIQLTKQQTHSTCTVITHGNVTGKYVREYWSQSSAKCAVEFKLGLCAQLLINRLNKITNKPNQLVLCCIANGERVSMMLEYPRKHQPMQPTRSLIQFYPE